MPATYSGTLTAAQVNALFQGFTVLAQRVSEATSAAELPATGGSVSTLVPNAMLAEMVGLQQPLATLVEALQNSRKSQITLFLCALTPRVRSILEIARLNSVFTIHESRDAALAG